MGKGKINKKFNSKNDTNFKFKGNSKIKKSEKKKKEEKDELPIEVTLPQDPFFYAKDQKALEDMANLHYNKIVGDTYLKYSADSTPIIAIIPYDHGLCAGTDEAPSGSYVQRAADAFFNYYTQGYTTGVDFEAPDVLMAVIAAASLSSVMLEMKRPFGLMHTFLQWNKGYAQRMVEALGLDFQDLKDNLAVFRTQYNLRVSTFNSTIAIPKSFMLLLQWGFIAGNVFTDTSSAEFSTAYAWKIRNAVQYNPTKLRTGSCLTWFSMQNESNTPLKISEWFNKVDQLFASFNDSDIRNMFGSIRRIYNPSDLLTLSEIDAEYDTSLLQHDTVAMQLHNLGWVNDIAGLYPIDDLTPGESNVPNVALFQTSDGAIRSAVSSTAAQSDNQDNDGLLYNDSEIILDMYDHLVNAGANIDATAYMNFAIPEQMPSNLHAQHGEIRYYKVIHRSTINVGFLLYTMDGIISVSKLLNSDMIVNNPSDFIAAISSISHLDSHPLLFVMTDVGASGINTGEFSTYRVDQILGEIDKYTGITPDYLDELNKQSMFQLLAMPANTKSTT
nr:putative capsid [Marmot picobirnavirus]